MLNMTDAHVPGGHDPIDDLIGSLDLEPDSDIDAVIYEQAGPPGPRSQLHEQVG